MAPIPSARPADGSSRDCYLTDPDPQLPCPEDGQKSQRLHKDKGRAEGDPPRLLAVNVFLMFGSIRYHVQCSCWGRRPSPRGWPLVLSCPQDARPGAATATLSP